MVYYPFTTRCEASGHFPSNGICYEGALVNGVLDCFTFGAQLFQLLERA